MSEGERMFRGETPSAGHQIPAERHPMRHPVLAILGFIVVVIAAILKVTGKHGSFVLWLIILAVALVAAGSAWDWYGRRGVTRTGA
jgi:hypothetical protein